MSAGDIVSQMFYAMVDGDADTFFSLVTEDFEFSGPIPEPVGAEDWFGFQQAMHQAFPDIDYNFQIMGEHGDHVHTMTQLSGTHTGDLDLSPLGLGVIPATGKSFKLPAEDGTAILVGSRVAALQIEPVSNGGMHGILSQLGIDMG